MGKSVMMDPTFLLRIMIHDFKGRAVCMELNTYEYIWSGIGLSFNHIQCLYNC